jgi:hypothetical protein
MHLHKSLVYGLGLDARKIPLVLEARVGDADDAT